MKARRSHTAPAARIRKLRGGDIPGCAALVEATPLWQRYGYGAERCARDLEAAAARGDRLLVAVANQRLAGLSWVLPTGGFGRLPYLKLLAVAEAARGQGVGEALLAASEANGDLLLMVSDFNRGARRFYARQGYLRIGALPGLVLPDVTELLLWKRVTRSVPAPRPPRSPGPARPRTRAPATGGR